MLAIYNKHAYYLWVGNPVVDFEFILLDESLENFWLVSSNGDIIQISKQEAQDRGFESLFNRNEYPFSENGYHITLFPYPHPREDVIGKRRKLIDFGLSNAIRDLGHYIMHQSIQGNALGIDGPFRIIMDYDANPDRTGRFFDFEAKALRFQIRNQLLDAIANNFEIEYVLKALSTFNFYRENHYIDYSWTRFLDSLEGIAVWFETAMILLTSYPDQIYNTSSLHVAISYIAREHRSIVF